MFGWLKKKPAAGNPAKEAITGQFALQAQLAGNSGRSMNITGYIYDGESRESLEARLDLLQEVIERQRVRSEIPELVAKREQMIRGIEQAREHLVALEEKLNAGTLSSAERQQVNNLRVNVKKMSEEVDKGMEAIQEAKKKAGVR